VVWLATEKGKDIFRTASEVQAFYLDLINR